MAQKKRKHTSVKKEGRKRSRSRLYKLSGLVIILLIAGFFIFDNLINNEPVEEYYTFKKEGEMIFTDSLGNTKVKIDIEIADNEYERQLGLMKRKDMKENQGMLFIFPTEQFRSFWMRNTLISLDMIFVNSKKEIVTIHKKTTVLSDQSYPSSQPAKYVVEVDAGFTDKYNIKIGDKVNWMDTKLDF